MIRRFRVKDYNFDTLAELNADTMESSIKEAKAQHCNMAKFVFGLKSESKVAFDVIIYPNE